MHIVIVAVAPSDAAAAAVAGSLAAAPPSTTALQCRLSFNSVEHSTVEKDEEKPL